MVKIAAVNSWLRGAIMSLTLWVEASFLSLQQLQDGWSQAASIQSRF